MYFSQQHSFVDLRDRGVEEREKCWFEFSQGKVQLVQLFLSLWIWFCPLTFKSTIVIVFIMWNECANNFLHALNCVSERVRFSHVFLLFCNGMLRIVFRLLRMNGMLDAFTISGFLSQLPSCPRFSTLKNFSFLNSFFS